MSELSDDAFKRASSGGWNPASDGATWTMVDSSLYEPGKQTAEMCPICVLLLETDEGTALFAKYMFMDLHITPYESSQGWHCMMCGASGEGRVPEFHDKPVKQESEQEDEKTD